MIAIGVANKVQQLILQQLWNSVVTTEFRNLSEIVIMEFRNYRIPKFPGLIIVPTQHNSQTFVFEKVLSRKIHFQF